MYMILQYTMGLAYTNVRKSSCICGFAFLTGQAICPAKSTSKSHSSTFLAKDVVACIGSQNLRTWQRQCLPIDKLSHNCPTTSAQEHTLYRRLKTKMMEAQAEIRTCRLNRYKGHKGLPTLFQSPILHAIHVSIRESPHVSSILNPVSVSRSTLWCRRNRAISTTMGVWNTAWSICPCQSGGGSSPAHTDGPHASLKHVSMTIYISQEFNGANNIIYEIKHSMYAFVLGVSESIYIELCCMHATEFC